MNTFKVFLGLVLALAVLLLIHYSVKLHSFQALLHGNGKSPTIWIVDNQTPSKFFKILYYDPPFNFNIRNGSQMIDFSMCSIKNCKFTINKSQAVDSDVIIFDGRDLKQKLLRPKGQIWIFGADESPPHLWNGLWNNYLNKEWNLTMTYDEKQSDIFWPYGDIRLRQSPVKKNWTAIFYNKTKDALIINSHCETQSKRELIVEALNKYIKVDTLGRCGTRWPCGELYVHDDCFSIINQYRFFLSFENSMCRGYFTEKIFENYDYDSIMVVRGGLKGEAAKKFPEGTFVSTDSFGSVHELGEYLKRLSTSVSEYTQMLERKSHYGNVGYQKVFQETMCRLCERLNKIDGKQNTISDIYQQVFNSTPCVSPSDLSKL